MNTQLKLATSHLLTVLGIVGTSLCIVGSLGVWYIESRIIRASEQAFSRIDHSLSAINSRLTEVQQLAAKSKISVEEVAQRLQESSRQEARERLTSRFEVEARVQQVSAKLHRAELMVELSHEAVMHVDQVLDVGVDLGISWNASLVDPLLEGIADIKNDLSHAIDTVESFGRHFGEEGDDRSMRKSVERVAEISSRLLATFGQIDSRLVSFRARLADARSATTQLNAKIRTRVATGAVCATLLLLWMAAGQLCLWRRGRKGGT